MYSGSKSWQKRLTASCNSFLLRLHNAITLNSICSKTSCRIFTSARTFSRVGMFLYAQFPINKANLIDALCCTTEMFVSTVVTAIWVRRLFRSFRTSHRKDNTFAPRKGKASILNESLFWLLNGTSLHDHCARKNYNFNFDVIKYRN